jgi:hypothetical protein
VSRYLVRDIDRKDVDELIDLCAEHADFEGAEYDSAGKAERLAEHLFGEHPSAQCVVAQGPDGRLAGYGSFSLEFSMWDAEHYVHVDCLYLRKERDTAESPWL